MALGPRVVAASTPQRVNGTWFETSRVDSSGGMAAAGIILTDPLEQESVAG